MIGSLKLLFNWIFNCSRATKENEESKEDKEPNEQQKIQVYPSVDRQQREKRYQDPWKEGPLLHVSDLLDKSPSCPLGDLKRVFQVSNDRDNYIYVFDRGTIRWNSMDDEYESYIVLSDGNHKEVENAKQLPDLWWHDYEPPLEHLYGKLTDIIASCWFPELEFLFENFIVRVYVEDGVIKGQEVSGCDLHANSAYLKLTEHHANILNRIGEESDVIDHGGLSNANEPVGWSPYDSGDQVQRVTHVTPWWLKLEPGAFNYEP